MKNTLVALSALIVAAVLEIGGDAAIRRGLVQSTWWALLAGAGMLVVYGFVVNFNRSIKFGELMGLYIAVFFIVSQVISMAFFAERPSVSLLLGGILIVVGGVVIQLGLR